MTAYTPIYNLPYVEASDLVASYPTVSEELAENVETAIAGSGGLILIDEETFSAASSVSLNNVFSATYDSYRVVIWVALTTGTQHLQMRLRNAGTDTTSGYSWSGLGRASNPATASYDSASANQINLPYVYTEYVGMTFDIHGPFIAQRKTLSGTANASDSGGNYYVAWCFGAASNTETSHDGFTIYPASSTITGTIRVYGYKEA